MSINQSRERRCMRPPVLCEDCTSVLYDFQQRKCQGCKFVADYVDVKHTVYFVARRYDKKFYTFYREERTGRRYVFSALQPAYSFVEAQSLLNHYAAERRWRRYDLSAEEMRA